MALFFEPLRVFEDGPANVITDIQQLVGFENRFHGGHFILVDGLGEQTCVPQARQRCIAPVQQRTEHTQTKADEKRPKAGKTKAGSRWAAPVDSARLVAAHERGAPQGG